jgi:unsaturated chondroitin disaccharide hydrolase
MTQLSEQLKPVMDFIVNKVQRNAAVIGANFPFYSMNGTYQFSKPSNWTSGFWPGLLWLVHEQTGDTMCKLQAEACEEQLDNVLHQFYELSHDMGFMWTLSSLANYKLTGNSESKRRALTAASHLAGRFNSRIGIIRAQNDRDDVPGSNVGATIIDCLMNLPLLYWASETTGDPRFRHVAINHTDTVLERLVRSDGSVAHVCSYDPEDGQFIELKAGQGYAADSAWSRGAAWALYGLTLGYAYTGKEVYLNGAKRVAHFFMSSLPKDKLPYWDFRLPVYDGAARDSSAASIAASGLAELARFVSASESVLYQQSAVQLVESLYESCGTWNDEEEQGLLLHATGNYPAGKEINVPIIYGDYYFAEAVYKLSGSAYTRFW